MSYYHAVTNLMGNDQTNIDSRIELKSNSELHSIAENGNSYLLQHILIIEMHVHCYFREYTLVVGLAKKYDATGTKRVLDFFHAFYLGICESFFISIPIDKPIIHFQF